jgi:hypothetical protein
VAINKPVIILNLGEQMDNLDYVKEGVALGAYSLDELKAAIDGLLKDDSCLRANRIGYIERYLYKIDCLSTQRVVNLVVRSLKCER